MSTANGKATTYPDIEEARTAHRELDELFKKHEGGWADEAALRKVRSLCWNARRLVDDAYCREKIGDVEEHAAMLFSVRRHHQWDRGAAPGARLLRVKILGSLSSFESRLATIEGARRHGGLDAYMAALAAPPRDD